VAAITLRPLNGRRKHVARMAAPATFNEPRPSVTMQLTELLAQFEPISLEELDRAAALQRRVDNKYLITHEQFARLAARLRRDHRVLEIDGERDSAYESVYFDTESLRCFEHHVADRRPRFKARSRLYQATGTCVFEVKLKRADGETDKRHLDQSVKAHGRLTLEAREFARRTLADVGLDAGDLRPTLITSFVRVTFGSDAASARATCDLRVSFSLPHGPAVHMREDYCLVETKSEQGQSPADRVLSELGAGQRSFSKYVVGTQVLNWGPESADPEVARALS